MSSQPYDPMRNGPRVTEPDMFPEPYPWCLGCGFQHQPNEHCPDCTGDHAGGFCLTPEAADELARLHTAEFRRQINYGADVLYARAVAFLARENQR